MTLKSIYISVIAIALVLMATLTRQGESSYTLKTAPQSITAGEVLNIEFDYNGNSEVVLYCSNSYGSSLIQPEKGETLLFKIPTEISNKSGVLSWELHTSSNPISGQIHILPKTEINAIETYIGPPSIEAGGTDYTMVVTIPTDHLDNPLKDSTKVAIKHQFLDTRKIDDIYTEHGFGYKNLYSYRPSGRMIINTECLGLNSKEFDVNVVPAIPTDFEISAKRIHNFADGNQITTIKTTLIKDRFDNIVSDGTFVSFFITNASGYKEETFGTTIDGIATAKMIHPDHEDSWSITAYVEGMANSNTISVNFEQAISDFDVSFAEDNRSITIGPLKSFMNQFIPNGLNVTLIISQNEKVIGEITEQSVEGFATFKLKKDRYPQGTYDIKIEAAGLKKVFPELIYE